MVLVFLGFETQPTPILLPSTTRLHLQREFHALLKGGNKAASPELRKGQCVFRSVCSTLNISSKKI